MHAHDRNMRNREQNLKEKAPRISQPKEITTNLFLIWKTSNLYKNRESGIMNICDPTIWLQLTLYLVLLLFPPYTPLNYFEAII